MEKLADGLQKLNEDDLLEVVTMIHDSKAPDTWMKNDVDSECIVAEYACRNAKLIADGEFHVDLYTLPDSCVRSLWDFVANKVDL
jgi:transcription initiation factor IIF auxiliary subunit